MAKELMNTILGRLSHFMRDKNVIVKMVAYDDRQQEMVFPVAKGQLQSGDLILIESGETVPADVKILWGECQVEEGLILGHAPDVEKKSRDFLVGGTMLVSGAVRCQVMAVGKDTVVALILRTVRKTANGQSLETCTALGIATTQGIIFRQTPALRKFAGVSQVVFNKTGTLTTGDFTIIRSFSEGLGPEEFKRIVFSLERHASHPIGRSLAREWRQKNELRFSQIEEIAGVGMRGVTKSGAIYEAGSYQVAAALTAEDFHTVYVVCNGVLLGWIDMEDQIRPDAAKLMENLRKNGSWSILLSGDRKEPCLKLAEALGIDEVFAGLEPAQRVQKMKELSAQAPTAALLENDPSVSAAATVSVSMCDPSQLGAQSTDIVLLNNDLWSLAGALSFRNLV